MKLTQAYIDEIIQRNFDLLETEEEIKNADGAQLIEGKWYMPLWGCDTMQYVLDEIRTLLPVRERK